MFSVALVCLFVCPQDNSKGYERILIKFAGDVRGATSNNWLDFGDVLADTDEMRGWNGFSRMQLHHLAEVCALRVLLVIIIIIIKN